VRDIAFSEIAITLRAPYTRCALVAATIWSLRTILWINLCCLLWALTDVSRQGGAPSIVATFGIANAAALLLWLLIVPRKYRARKACSIIFLRGFKQEARADVPNRVLPCIGCYGRIMWLRNVVKVVNQDRIGPLSGETITDTREQPDLREEWKSELQKLLQLADLAVIDFSVLSESLFWEIEQCLRQMPAQRIILIAELSHHASSNYQVLCNKFPELWNVPSPIPIYPSRFVIPLRFWAWWFFQYERRVHRCMKAIAAQKLAVRRPGSALGQGPTPRHADTSERQ